MLFVSRCLLCGVSWSTVSQQSSFQSGVSLFVVLSASSSLELVRMICRVNGSPVPHVIPDRCIWSGAIKQLMLKSLPPLSFKLSQQGLHFMVDISHAVPEPASFTSRFSSPLPPYVFFFKYIPCSMWLISKFVICLFLSLLTLPPPPFSPN